MTTIIETLKGEFHLSEKVLSRTIDLIDAGNTIPFIARYRKEETGNMNDTVLRELNDRLGYLRRLEARKADVAETIKAQDKWTPALEKALSRAATMQEVEDLYLPFKKKRRTRAMKAKEAGLEPLAKALKAGESDDGLLAMAQDFVDADKGVASAEQAVQGAQDIVAEEISEQAVFRKNIREVLEKRSVISTEVKPEFADQKTAYLDYYHHTEAIAHMANHRILAINRGEREKVLSVKIDAFEAQTIRYLMKKTAPCPEDDAHHYFAQAVADSYKRLIWCSSHSHRNCYHFGLGESRSNRTEVTQLLILFRMDSTLKCFCSHNSSIITPVFLSCNIFASHHQDLHYKRAGNNQFIKN